MVTHFQELIDEYVKYFNEKNAERIAELCPELYSSDAVLFPPNEETIEGIEATCDYWQELLTGRDWVELVSTVYRVERSGNLAMQMNRWIVRVKQANGSVQEDRGKTLNVWRLEKDGKWRVFVDSWSSDLPQGKSVASGTSK